MLTETPASFAEWKRLIVTHRVSGVQVHGTRLVAVMLKKGITHRSMLNGADFRRFAGVTGVKPEDVLAGAVP